MKTGLWECRQHKLIQFRGGEVERIYYQIGEVARLYGVAPSMIRFWLQEFGIEVKKNSKGNRRFTKQDVDLVGQIYELIKIKRYTLEGAKMQLFAKETVLN